jgi:ferritin-like protein
LNLPPATVISAALRQQGHEMAGETLHEEREVLGPEILDRHRAISTIMEELEAIDWYDQRITASSDAELQAVLAHNRNEEKEHASMLLEWLRRHDQELDTHLRNYLFKQGPIREVSAGGAPAGATTSLAIGSLKD